MNILVVGKGGREHALAWKLSQSPRVDKLYVAPGNPGIATLAECVDIRVDTPVSDRDKLTGEIGRLIEFAKDQRIDLTVVGPDDALAGGIVDRFQASGLKIFGPTEAAAQIESSKAFAKELMERIGVPTARHRSFTDADAACAYIRAEGAPIVIKASGLAAGKGAFVCHDETEALSTAREMLEEGTFGGAGSEIVIEDYMVGEEASLFALCDGEHYVTLVPAQDHKAIYEGDRGPNTGGMGSYAPAPVMTPELVQEAEDRIIRPVLDEMRRMGIPYKGVLYCGLMFTEEGPKVVEFNARFGDPECQILMPLLTSDLVDVLEAACDGRLHEIQIQNSDAAAVCVVMASEGYPGAYEKGFTIDGLQAFADRDDIVIFHAGTAHRDGSFFTDSGRVLCVTAIGDDIESAVHKAYAAIDGITYDNVYFRRDIAHRALRRKD